MFAPAPISDEQKTRLRKLAWSTVQRFVLATASAIGAKLGERAVEWLVGDNDDDEDDEEDKVQ